MRRYNFIRPIILIAVALISRSLVTNLCMLFGMEQEAAGNIGFFAMLVAAIVVYYRFSKQNRR